MKVFVWLLVTVILASTTAGEFQFCIAEARLHGDPVFLMYYCYYSECIYSQHLSTSLEYFSGQQQTNTHQATGTNSRGHRGQRGRIPLAGSFI